ncbi:MAG TPA: hypothetical protein VJN94_13205 [Candidatus Binataceae bacterium]|nr:hypothetical protein [Candidatus Binataceae bacterium]
MLNLNFILERLSARRPIFHSEADLQYELAREFHLLDAEAEIRLERPVGNMRVDMMVRDRQSYCALELKYKTARSIVNHRNEQFDLAAQGAQDIGRYDYVKDISPLEGLVATGVVWDGWAILITNDRSYWLPDGHGAQDEAFRVHEGRVLEGHLAWLANAAPGAILGHEAPLRLVNTYQVSWRDYSEIGNNVFRYLAIHVA